VISGIWVAAHESAPAWMMISFTGVAIFDLADISWIPWERSLTYFEIAP
jgi:hypothetical protein